MKSGQVHVVGTKTDRLTHRRVRQYEATVSAEWESFEEISEEP